MDATADRSPDARVIAVAEKLRVDAATAEVLRAFGAASVDAILLKGVSIARWLYLGEESRSYRDCDLLVPPCQVSLADKVLERQGFAPRFSSKGMPEWWSDHSSDWLRAEDGVLVDLHTRLPGLGVDPTTAWRILSENAEKLPVAGHPAQVLALPGRILSVALHAAHHGVRHPQPMADLERALAQVDEALWRSAMELAERLDAIEAFGVGVRLAPAGRRLAEVLGLPVERSVRTALLASSPPPVALGVDQIAQARGVRTRAAIVARKVVPPVSFMRRWYPHASRSRTGLLFAYLYRPLWLVRCAPRALRAWWHAQRNVPGR